MPNDAARLVDESELTEEQRRYVAERHAARQAHQSFAGGNPLTIEQMRRLVASSDEMRRTADADRRANERARAEQKAELARQRAERERAEQREASARLKEEQRRIWVARDLDPDRFEGAWPQLEIEIALRAQGGADEAEQLKAQKRASGIYS